MHLVRASHLECALIFFFPHGSCPDRMQVRLVEKYYGDEGSGQGHVRRWTRHLLDWHLDLLRQGRLGGSYGREAVDGIRAALGDWMDVRGGALPSIKMLCSEVRLAQGFSTFFWLGPLLFLRGGGRGEIVSKYYYTVCPRPSCNTFRPETAVF